MIKPVKILMCVIHLVSEQYVTIKQSVYTHFSIVI